MGPWAPAALLLPELKSGPREENRDCVPRMQIPNLSGLFGKSLGPSIRGLDLDVPTPSASSLGLSFLTWEVAVIPTLQASGNSWRPLVVKIHSQLHGREGSYDSIYLHIKELRTVPGI